MGELIIPTDKNIIGPWLLDKIALEELNSFIEFVENKFKEGQLSILQNMTEDEFADILRKNKDLALESLKLMLQDEFSKKKDTEVILKSKDGISIKDNSLISILKDSKVNDFKPVSLIIRIQKGPSEFSFEISKSGTLETRIKSPDDNLVSDINYELDKWIDIHKPNIIVEKWASWYLNVFTLSFFVLLFGTILFMGDNRAIYKEKFSKESLELLKGGISPQKTDKAIELILKIESGYVPDNVTAGVTVNKSYLNFCFFVFICFVILSVKPSTIIGIGKNKWKVDFFKYWIYIVGFIIPTTIIVPIILNKFF